MDDPMVADGLNARGWDRLAPFTAGVLCIFVLYLRTSSSFFSPQFWAEDGTIFWHQQAVLGWKVMLFPYAGYYHLLPRFVAGVSSLFDPAHAPTFFFVGCIAFTFWSAATAASSVSDPRLGILLGVGLMLPPVGLSETLGTITNVQWIMAPTLGLSLLSSRLSLNRIAYASVGALTGPFSVFLVPIALYRFYQSRDKISAIVLIGGLIQIVTIFFENKPAYPTTDGTVQHLLGVLAFRPFMFSTVCAVLGAAVVFASAQSQHRGFRCLLIYFAIAVTAGTLFRFWKAPLTFDSEFDGARYFYIPRVAAIWCAMSIAFIDWKNAALALAFILSLEFAGLEHLKKAPLPDAEWTRHYRAGASSITINPPAFKVTIPNR